MIQGKIAILMTSQPVSPTKPAPKSKQSDPLAIRLCLTYASSIAAESCTYPLDFTKTRLQLQGQGKNLGKKQLGAISMAIHIIKNEGVLGIFSGLKPALLRHFIYTPTRIVGYETFRQYFAGANGDVTKIPLWQRGFSGAMAGMIGQFVASPADLVKVRMQAAGRGQGPQYTGVMDAFGKIFKEGGVKGLWKGWLPNVQRAGFVNLGELATYDAAKQTLLHSGYFDDTVWCHAASSGISGFVSALVSSPADVMKSRLMANMVKENGEPMYRGMIDCLNKTVKKEGVLSLWKGFMPAWTRLAPWQLIFWLSYEELRRVSGVSSF